MVDYRQLVVVLISVAFVALLLYFAFIVLRLAARQIWPEGRKLSRMLGDGASLQLRRIETGSAEWSEFENLSGPQRRGTVIYTNYENDLFVTEVPLPDDSACGITLRLQHARFPSAVQYHTRDEISEAIMRAFQMHDRLLPQFLESFVVVTTDSSPEPLPTSIQEYVLAAMHNPRFSKALMTHSTAFQEKRMNITPQASKFQNISELKTFIHFSKELRTVTESTHRDAANSQN